MADVTTFPQTKMTWCAGQTMMKIILSFLTTLILDLDQRVLELYCCTADLLLIYGSINRNTAEPDMLTSLHPISNQILLKV